MKDISKDEMAEKVVDKLSKLLAKRADSWEVYISSESGFGAEAREGKLDALKVRYSSGVGVRTVLANRPGFASTTVFDDAAIIELVDKAVGGTGATTADEFLCFPIRANGALEPGLGLVDPSVLDIPEEERIKAALRIEEAAMSEARVKRVRKASYSQTMATTRVVNSSGVDCAHDATYFSASVSAIAEEGNEAQMGWESETSHMYSGLDPERIGKGAAKNAIRLLGARTIDTVRCPAVIENAVATELIDALSGSFLGDNVFKGKSMLADKLGKKVASHALNVIDDGVMFGGWASSAYDGEGVPRQRSVLLRGGVLERFLYDTYWGKRCNAASTGSAVRPGYKGGVSPGASNLYIEKGARPLGELIKGVKKGLFITEVMGMHTVDPISGDFSVGASGIWIEDGQEAFAVRGLAISGNLLRLFEGVEECGSDLRFFGSIGAPSMLINEIEASGK